MKQQNAPDYRGYRTAGIRFSEELAPELSHGREADERGALYAFHMYDKAHNVMLAEQRLVPDGVGAKILEGLRALEKEPGGAEEARARIGGGMHSGEYYLIRSLGEDVGGWDHVGRSSACLATVGRRILQRDGLLDLFEALCAFRRVLISLAEIHANSVLTGFFFTQICQPTTYGHVLLGYAQALGRDAERAREAYRRINLNPGGGVVLTGTAFAIDRARVADLMGFDGVVENALDAIDGNDTAIECFSLLAIIAQNIERLTAHLERWIAAENEQLDIADRYRASSSLAMNMKTPVLPGRAISANFVGDLVKAFSSAGTLGAINPDGALRTMAGTLRFYGRMLGAVSVNEQKAAASLKSQGFAGGTDLGVLLVNERELPWRTAHQICGILFRLCEERGIGPSAITGELLDEAAIDYFGRPLGLSTEQVQQAMDPLHIVRSRSHFGGCSPDQVSAAAARLTAQLESDEGWLAGRRAAIGQSARKLEDAIDQIAMARVSE